MFVAVAGNIGAGKSSLTKVLAESFALEPIFEAVDENPYLEDFYADMPRYAFHSQMFFLAKAFGAARSAGQTGPPRHSRPDDVRRRRDFRPQPF